MPNDELTYPPARAYPAEVILGAPAPREESPDAQAWRHECEREVAKIKAQGVMTEIPFDPTYDDRSQTGGFQGCTVQP